MDTNDLEQRFGTKFVEVDGGAVFEHNGTGYFLPEGTKIHPFAKKIEKVIAVSEIVELAEGNEPEPADVDIELDFTPMSGTDNDEDHPIEVALRITNHNQKPNRWMCQAVYIRNNVVIHREDVSGVQTRLGALRTLDRQTTKFFARGDGTVEAV
jgi:hypothetical protein